MATHSQNDKKVNTRLQKAIETILTDRPIAYHAVLAKAVGSANAGIFLSQLLYWTPRAHDKEGWIYKTQQDIYEETALTRREQETARRMLRTAKVLEEKKAGVPSRLFFRVDMGYLAQLLGGDNDDGDYHDEIPEPDEPNPRGASHDVQNVHRTMAETDTLGWPKLANKNGGNRHTIYETEITTEITTESVVVKESLQNFGISKSAATQLSADYPEELILDKLNLAQWLVSTGSPAVSKNPAGWLRKAIEEDYTPPRNYESSRDKKEKSARAAQIAEREAKERGLMTAEYNRVRAESKEQLLQKFPPEPVGEGMTTHTAWEQVLDNLKEEVGEANYETWLKDTVLLEVSDSAAKIVVASPFAVAWIERRLYKPIKGTLKDVLKRDVDLQFVPAENLAA